MGATISIIAEKPSIARSIVRAFSITFKLKFKGHKSKSRFNYVYESEIDTQKIAFTIEKDKYRLGKSDVIIISSVTGHVLNFDYPPPFDKETNWQNSDPLDLIELDPIEVPIQENMIEHIQDIGYKTDVIIVATDWDGHGEAIGRQIVELMTKVNKKIRHGRMHFTSTSPNALKNAFETQTKLNWDWIKQVDSLRKQDLRMGSSLTRFLTVGIQDKGIRNRIISYGPCQTSVLWLIANRYQENQAFHPSKFWKMSIKLNISDNPLFLYWKGNPSEDEEIVDSLIKKIEDNPKGIISDYNEENGFIKRPIPLDTDTLESECSQIFRISPKLVADIAEKLYNNGFITYPRTESSYYLEKDLTKLTEKFLNHEVFGKVAEECITLGGVKDPSKGRFSKDHEPIKPVKAISLSDVEKTFFKTPRIITNAWNIYSYIVWRFLATVHVNASIVNQYIMLNVVSEEFNSEGRKIIDLGFFKFYPYRELKVESIPYLKKGTELVVEVFKHHGYTIPPPLLSESDLIRVMADLNLGTDATRSTHIDTVQKRNYTSIQGPKRVLVPTALGSALFEVLTQNAEDLILPEIRGKVEAWTQQIRDHEKTPEDVDKLVIELTTRGLQKLKSNRDEVFDTLVSSIKSMTGVGNYYGRCPDCEGELELHQGKEDSRFLKCTNPLCDASFPLPKRGALSVLDQEYHCRICASSTLLVQSKRVYWFLCPVCWTREGTKETPWFCSDCNRSECPLSGSWKPSTSICNLGECPDCKGPLTLNYEEENTQIFCQSCKRTWRSPNIRQGGSITPSIECSTCGRKTLSVIKRGKKPYRLCVFCSVFFFD